MSYRAEISAMLRNMPPDWHRQYRVGRETLARNGGPVLPNVPTPEQAMLILANTAGGNFDTDQPTGNQKVPKAVRDAAMKGLRLSHRNNYGGWEFFGIARAIQLALVPAVPMRTRERMVRYLEAHEKDKAGSNFGNDARPSRGYMAWLNWGGDPAMEWNRRDGISRATYGGRRNPRYTSAVRTDPELWEEVKAEVTRGSRGGLPGQWSARKAQFAVALYQDRGGGYVGPKSPRNALAKWTREQWRTKSGRPSLETGERYLPAAAIAALTPAEYAATSRAKRAGMRHGEQFVPQPERIAKKVKRYRRNPEMDKVSKATEALLRETFRVLGDPDEAEAKHIRAARDRLVQQLDRLFSERDALLETQWRKETDAKVREAEASAIRRERASLWASVNRQLLSVLDGVRHVADDYVRTIRQAVNARPNEERLWERLDGALGCARLVAEAVEEAKAKIASNSFDYQPVIAPYDAYVSQVRQRKFL